MAVVAAGEPVPSPPPGHSGHKITEITWHDDMIRCGYAGQPSNENECLQNITDTCWLQI